jgi:hypothetical protein
MNNQNTGEKGEHGMFGRKDKTRRETKNKKNELVIVPKAMKVIR